MDLAISKVLPLREHHRNHQWGKRIRNIFEGFGGDMVEDGRERVRFEFDVTVYREISREIMLITSMESYLV